MSKRENWLNILRQRDRDREKKARMAEMDEMDKAFDDFDKACQKTIGACNDFIDMDINKTSEVQESTQKIEDATQLPRVTIVHKRARDYDRD